MDTAAFEKSVKDEKEFLGFYRKWAKTSGINPNPDDPEHHYDYRAAYAMGHRPKPGDHWPSEFKKATHPNRFVEGVDTLVGKRMTLQDIASQVSRYKK